jgi:hypothetical protein
MSDTPHSPGWWQAGDGRWYPPPPGLGDETPARPPMPAPDHPPSAVDPQASGPSAPLAPEPPSPRRRVGPVLISALSVLLVIALILGVSFAVSDHSSKTASANDRDYQLVINQLVDSEFTNLVFIETFWESYGQFTDEYNTASPAEQPAIAERWLDDIESQVAQFEDDLALIESDFALQSYKEGSIPDSIRDEAIAHYRTWSQWASEIVSIAREWLVLESSPLSLYGYVTEVAPNLDGRIESTFLQLCETLTETQPTNGSYEVTILEICETS